VRVYRIDIAPSDSDGEGEDHSEWFSNLALAKKRRRALIASGAGGERYGEDYEISAYELPKLPPLKLALWCLDRRWEAQCGVVVVPAWRRPKLSLERWARTRSRAEPDEPRAVRSSTSS